MKAKYIKPGIDIYTMEMKSLICGSQSLSDDGTNVTQTGAATTTETSNNLSRGDNGMWVDDPDDK